MTSRRWVWHYVQTPMHPRELLEANLGVVERAIGAVCAHAGLRGADAEDFGSSVKLALLEDDCAIVRRWEERSSFATYVTVVIRRLLVDHQRRAGRWYSSAAAQRQGEAAVLLERLLSRDRRSFDEALAIVLATHPEVTPAQIAAMAATLPARPARPVLVPIDDDDRDRFAGPQRADERVTELELAQRARHASRVVREAMQSMTAEDRVVLRLRFSEELPVADIGRSLGIPQRPLYRRIETLLTLLRRALERAGLHALPVSDLIGTAGEHLDFQFRGKTDPEHPSLPGEGSEGLR